MKHEDFCAYWDDDKFCTCGAKQHERLLKLAKTWRERDSFQRAERFNGYAGYWLLAAEELEAILQPNDQAHLRERSVAR